MLGLGSAGALLGLEAPQLVLALAPLLVPPLVLALALPLVLMLALLLAPPPVGGARTVARSSLNQGEHDLT